MQVSSGTVSSWLGNLVIQPRLQLSKRAKPAFEWAKPACGACGGQTKPVCAKPACGTSKGHMTLWAGPACIAAGSPQPVLLGKSLSTTGQFH